MKWIAISGSWRLTSPEVEKDVRSAVRDIILRGDGIVTGGALNVDYFATDEALKLDPEARRIRVCLPVRLELYAAHYRTRAKEGVITSAQAEGLVEQLSQLRSANPQALIEHPTNTVVDQSTYYERNGEVMRRADELLAFQVNGSPGVQDTIEKAQASGKVVQVKNYDL